MCLKHMEMTEEKVSELKNRPIEIIYSTKEKEWVTMAETG